MKKTHYIAALIVMMLYAHTQASVNETIHIIASDAGDNDRFGQAVAVDGSTAIIGAFRNDEKGFNSGSAYLFDTTTGEELFKLTTSDAHAGGEVGKSVAINGDRAVISGSNYDDVTESYEYSAYIFDTTTGEQVQKFTPVEANDDYYHPDIGMPVAIRGNIGLLGVPTGSARVFDVTTGNELHKLTASQSDAHGFGSSVAISGDYAIVGAPYSSEAGFRSGSAYVYDLTTGDELFILTASDADAEDVFGFSVSISGNTAIVGAFGNNDAGYRSGSAYTFDITTGNELFKLTASDADWGDTFGSSVAIDGHVAVIGAINNQDAGEESGSAYVFDTNTGQELYKLIGTDTTEFDRFAWSVAIEGTTIITGAPTHGNGDIYGGSAYVFNNIPEPSSFYLLVISVMTVIKQRLRTETHIGLPSIVAS